jgi:hypothetical protein
MSRVLCETWDSTAHPAWGFGNATTGKGTTSVVPLRRQKIYSRSALLTLSGKQPTETFSLVRPVPSMDCPIATLGTRLTSSGRGKDNYTRDPRI